MRALNVNWIKIDFLFTFSARRNPPFARSNIQYGGPPMVAGYHLICTAYGYWLPNEPRGSTSLTVRVEKLRPLGDVHYGRKQIQPSSATLREFHSKARDLLAHAVLTFDDEDIQLIGKTIGDQIVEHGYTCYACAVMPDHVHLLIRRHRDKAEQMIQFFQAATRAALVEAGKRSPPHPVWTDGPGWKGFINTRGDFEREIEYIRKNPEKIGRSEQVWEFVKPYQGWLPGYRG
jgi:REP element-mobilizing transposase RayT